MHTPKEWFSKDDYTGTVFVNSLVNVRRLEIAKDHFIALKPCFQSNIDEIKIDLYICFLRKTAAGKRILKAKVD